MIVQPCPGCAATNQGQLERIHQLERELAEARKDAERYRWLRDQPWVEPEATEQLSLPRAAWLKQYHAALDAAIDAARKP